MATLVKIQGNAVFNGGVKFQVTGVDTPLTPSLSSITSSGFTLSWDQVQDAFEYQLDISTNSNFSSFVAGYNNTTVPTTSAVVTGLSPQTTYWARIRAVVASNNSASVSGTTLEATSTLTNGLLAFYKLSDTSDSSGNNRTLTNGGGVTFSSGKIGNAAQFNGSNYLELNENLLADRSTVSLSMWVKTTDNDGYVLSCGGIAGIVVVNAGGRFTFNTSSGYSPIQTNIFVNDNQWHHLVATFGNGSVVLYVDGQQSITGNTNSTVANSGVNKTRIGHNNVDSYASYTGEVDAVGIWSRALTDAEVTELYNVGNGLEIN